MDTSKIGGFILFTIYISPKILFKKRLDFPTMILDEYEEPTIGNKIVRFLVGVFLTILVSMLIITLLPGDAEQNIFRMLTGQDNFSYGKIGDETITPDYFQSARKDCFQRYKDYNANLANDSSELNSCAYDTIKSFKVYKVLASAVGYGISENRLKEIIWEQAKQSHKESNMGAGYTEEDKLSKEEIYKNLLRATPLVYRQDYVTEMEFDRFLYSDIKPSPDEEKINKESSLAKLTFSYIQISDSDLLNKIGDTVAVSEEEIKSDYDKSVKDGTLNKTPEGKLPTFEERKSFIENKLKVEKKQALLGNLKAKLLSTKNEKGKLSDLMQLSGVSIAEVKDMPLSDISKGNENKTLAFTGNSSFLRDLGEVVFGTGIVSGPYPDGDKVIYVDFKELKIEMEGKVDENNSNNLSNIRIFLMEINNSLKSIYPIYRKMDKQDN